MKVVLNNINLSNAAKAWQIGFQDPATSLIQYIINFHNYLTTSTGYNFLMPVIILVFFFIYKLFKYNTQFKIFNCSPIGHKFVIIFIMPIIIFALNISYKSLHYNTKYKIFKPSFQGYKLLMFFIVPIMKLTILFLSKFLKFYSQKNDIQLLVIHDESFLTRLIILSYKIILLMDSVKSESRIDLMFLRNIFWVNSEPVPIYNWHHRPLGPCTFVNGRPMMTLGARLPETYMGSANVRFLSLQLEGIHFRCYNSGGRDTFCFSKWLPTRPSSGFYFAKFGRSSIRPGTYVWYSNYWNKRIYSCSYIDLKFFLYYDNYKSINKKL